VVLVHRNHFSFFFLIYNCFSGTLSSLASVKITYCPKLDSIFTTSIAKTLTSLEELFIYGCKSLKDIVTLDDCQSDISIFQSLKNLRISRCDLLEGIFPVSFVGGMMKFNHITNEDNTQIELPALEALELDHIRDRTILGTYHVPSLRTLSLNIGRYVGFFNINCSTDASEAIKKDFIAIKV